MVLNNKNGSPDISKKLRRVIIALFLLTGLACIAFLAGCEENQAVPDEEIAATVNGEVITMEEFENALELEKMQFLMQGMDLDQPEMAETLAQLEQYVIDNYFIVPTLLVQEAEAEGITASENELQERYQEYVIAFGGEEALQQQMESVNISMEAFEKDIYRELTIELYLDHYMEIYFANNPAERIVESEIEVEEAEVEAYYTQILQEYSQLKELLESPDQEIPADQLEQLEMYLMQLEMEYGDLIESDDPEALKDELRKEFQAFMTNQLREEKRQRIFSEHLEELRGSSEIELMI